MTSAADNCRVVVRVKPPAVDDEVCLAWDGPDGVPRRLLFPDMDRSYLFDAILPPTASQIDCYRTACVDMFTSFIEGFNCCLFAYGQTGSGKSFTMGTTQTRIEDRGIVPRGLIDFFEAIKVKQQKGWSLKVSVTYIEIYNEEIRDLLNPEGVPINSHKVSSPLMSHPGGVGLFGSQPVASSRPGTSGGIKITQDAQSNQIQLIGVKNVEVNSVSEAMECLMAGGLYRSTGSNKLNLTSSRSHAIFTLMLEQCEQNDDDEFIPTSIISKFHFVDLAGSERVKRTQSMGSRLREGININSGLLALSNVINALTEETQTVSHVPYRDSKLTRLLQDSLGGNSKTVMIACVSAARQDFAETFSTIKYATRARNIKNTPVVNKDPQTVLIESLRQRLDGLMSELEVLKSGSGVQVADLQREIDDLKSVINDREQREAEERAKRIALEAKLLKYKSKYKNLIRDLKSQVQNTTTSLQVFDESDEDEDQLSSTEEVLVKTSDLELMNERLRQELRMLKDTHETECRLVSTHKQDDRLDRLLKLIRRLAAEQGAGDDSTESSDSISLHKYVTAASGENYEQFVENFKDTPIQSKPQGDLPSQDRPWAEDQPWSAKLNVSLKEALNLDEAQIFRILFSANDEDQSALLCLVESLSGESAINEQLKSRSERLTQTIKWTADLLNGTELEKRHWEKVVSDLSMRIASLEKQLEASESVKQNLKARIEAIDDTSEGVTITPSEEGSSPEDVSKERVSEAESVKLRRKLDHQNEQYECREGRLKILRTELEEVHRKKEISRKQIKSFEADLLQLKNEKLSVLKKITEQEKKHKASLLEKDRFISKLEKEAKRHDEELRSERAEHLEKITKIQNLQRKNEDLVKRIHQLTNPTRQISTQPISSFAKPTVASQRGGPDTGGFQRGDDFTVVSRASGGGASERNSSRLLTKTTSNVSQQVKRYGGAVFNQSDPTVARRLLTRGAEAKLDQLRHEEQLSKKLRKLAKLEGNLQTLMSSGNSRDDMDKIDAVKGEVAMCKGEIEKLQNHKTCKSQLVAELKSDVRASPDIYLEAYMDMYVELMEQSRKLSLDLNKKEIELSDLRDLRSRAQAREDALKADFERRKIELMLTCNEDKLVFMRSLIQPCESENDLKEMELRILRDQVNLLTKQKGLLNKQRDTHSDTLPRRGRPSVTAHMSAEEKRRTCSSTPSSKKPVDRLPPSLNRHPSLGPVCVSARQESAKHTPTNRAGNPQISLLTCIDDAHGDYVTSVVASCVKSERMPTQVVTGSLGEIRAWDLWRLDSKNPRDSMTFSWEDTRTLQNDANTFLRSIDVLEDNVIVAAVGTTIKILDLRTPDPVHSWLLAPPSDIEAGAPMPIVNSICVMSPDGQHLVAACGSDKTVRLFDARQRSVLPLCKVPTGEEQHCVTYLPQPPDYGDHTPAHNRSFAQTVMNGLTTGGESGVVKMWNQGFTQLPSTHNLSRITALKSATLNMPFRGLFCCCERDERLRLWAWTDSLVDQLNRRDPTLSVGPGQHVVRHPPAIVGRLGGDDEVTSDTSEDQRTVSKSLSALTVLPSARCDANDVVTGDRRGQLSLWSVEGQEANISLTQQTAAVPVYHARNRRINQLESFQASRGGHLLFSVGDDTTLKVWHAR